MWLPCPGLRVMCQTVYYFYFVRCMNASSLYAPNHSEISWVPVKSWKNMCRIRLQDNTSGVIHGISTISEYNYLSVHYFKLVFKKITLLWIIAYFSFQCLIYKFTSQPGLFFFTCFLDINYLFMSACQIYSRIIVSVIYILFVSTSEIVGTYCRAEGSRFRRYEV